MYSNDCFIYSALLENIFVLECFNTDQMAKRRQCQIYS